MTTPTGPVPAVSTGFFLCLDGPDGSGKSTQVHHLVAWFRQHSLEVVPCRDPGGTPLGEQVRGLLLDRHDLPLALRAEMLLYMASRAQLVEEVIRPALAAGKIVVSDRYLLANLVYQGYAGGLPISEIWDVGRIATGGLLPGLTLVLDVPAQVAEERMARGRDRIERRPTEYHDRVRKGFLHLAESYPAPLALIDATADEETVASRIQHEVARALGPSSRT